MDETDEDTLQIHVIFVHLCNFARLYFARLYFARLYFAHLYFISVLEASKQIFVLVAGFKFLYWFQISVLVSDFWFQISVLVSDFLY